MDLRARHGYGSGVSDLTQNSGRGYPARYNDFDFTRDFSGSLQPKLTASSGRGYPSRYNDFDFTRTPQDPGGGYAEFSGTASAAVSITVQAIDGFDVVVAAYGGIDIQFIGADSEITVSAIDDVLVLRTVAVDPPSGYSVWVEQ